MTKSIIATAALVAAFFMPAWAAPPEGIEQKMIPMSGICLTAEVNPHHFGAIVGALQEDYQTHIVYTFDGTPDGYQKIIILINPETALGGVAMVTPEQTCIIFSGESLEGPFIRADMPPPKENEAPKT